MDVHVRDLRYFLAVAEELHFTRAAQRLYISQPALSKQIRALERQLRTPLFERTGGDVRLTRAGSALVDHASAVVAGWQQAQKELSRLSGSTIVIGMHTSPGRGVLPQVRARMVADCPDARFELRQVAWSDRTAGLGDGSTDAAFIWQPLPGAPYRSIPIAREPRLVALSAGHPLAGRDDVAMADLLDEPFLALPASAGPLRDYWLALDHRDGRPARIAGEITDTEETYEAVASGIGVCLLAAGNAPIFDRGGITMLPVRDLSPSALVLAWSERNCPPLLHTFIECCAEVAADSPGPERDAGAFTSRGSSWRVRPSA